MAYRHPIAPDLNPQKVTLSVASAQSAAFAATSKAVRVVSDVDCWIVFGTNPTATTAGIYLPAKFPQVLGILPNASQKIAAIAGGAGNLYITEAFAA